MNKYISLIYKKLDNTISEKELIKLNKKLSKDSELYKEYELIKTITEELKETPLQPLPENFKHILKTKLVQCEYNKKRKSEYKIPIYALASLAALFIITFAINGLNNINGLRATENTERLYKTTSSEIIENSGARIVAEECIIINCKPEAFNVLDISDNKSDKLYLPKEDYSETKQKISEYIISIENEETANAAYFIIQMNKNLSISDD